MEKRFAKRMEKAQNPRARKHNGKSPTKFVRPSSHVGSVLSDLTSDKDVGGSMRIYHPNPVVTNMNVAEVAFAPVKAAEMLAIAAVQDGIDSVRSRLGAKEKKLKTEKRRKYYATDAARREEQREMIRAARPPVTCACPTPKEIEEAYARRRESEEWKVRFGELMIDLEEHVRREWQITGNKFSGSSGGVKDWLKENCPHLAKHYATCQRYKRLAQEELPYIS